MLRAARLYAVDRYPDPDDWLSMPVKDAKDLSRLLRSPYGGEFADEDVIVRADGQASWESFQIDMGFLARLGRIDYLLVTLQGHGVDRGFAFHDRIVSYEDIASCLRKVNARIKVVVVDACMSGGATEMIAGLGDVDARASAAERIAEALSVACPGLRTLTAANRRGLVRDDASLVRALIQAVQVAAPDGVGNTITLAKAFELARAWMRQNLGRQYPWPQSRGDLEVPFAVSGLFTPFGELLVMAGPGWTSHGGRRVHVPLEAVIRGRRFLQTSARVRLATFRGEHEVTTHRFYQRGQAHRESLNVYVGAGVAREYGARLLVDALDEYGEQVGPTFEHRLDPVFDALPLAL